MTHRIINADCRNAMADMPANSVDAIVTDPPYFKVKDCPWDRQWDKPEGFLAWIGELCEQWQRILRPNGSLYVFASPQMGGRVECEIRKRFNVLNHIVWVKADKRGGGAHNKACKADLRSFFPQTERLIFAEHFGADNIAKGEAGYAAKCDELRGFVFEPLRAYLAGEWERAGLTKKDAEEATGTQMAGHWFTRSQWCLPTRENYEILQARANDHLRREYEDLRREYEDLRREYEDLRREYEDLRRPFSVTSDIQYTDVWNFTTVQAYRGKHPCEKPLDLMEHIISTSTKPGAVVLDCFMGSGKTGEAAVRLGREFIGIEINARDCERAEARIRAACSVKAAPRVAIPFSANRNHQNRIPRRPSPADQIALFGDAE